MKSKTSKERGGKQENTVTTYGRSKISRSKKRWNSRFKKMPRAKAIAVKPKTRKKVITKKILDAVEQLVANSDSKDLEQLTGLLTTQEDRDTKNDSDESLKLLELENLKLLYEYRQRLLKNSLTSTQVAELVGWNNRKTTHDRLKAKDIIGIKDKGAFRFPMWQFDPEGDNGILDGLPELLSALEISDFRKLNWLTKPLRTFDGMTPVEILKQGDRDEIGDLIIEAEGVGVLQ